MKVVMRARKLLWVGSVFAGSVLLCQPAGAATTILISDFIHSANGVSESPSISADGDVIAYASDATNLVAETDGNGVTDIFVRFFDADGISERVSVSSAGIEANGASTEPSVSLDGRFVAFTSRGDNLVPDDTNGVSDIFVHDRVTGVTERVSLDENDAQEAKGSRSPSISGDGRLVAFVLDRRDGHTFGDDVMVRDRLTGTTRQVSQNYWTSFINISPSISGNGRWLAWTCWPDTTTENPHICVKDLQADAAAQRITIARSGRRDAAPEIGDTGPSEPSISADGRFIAFTAEEDENLNHLPDVYVIDRVDPRSGTPIWRVSVSTTGGETNGASYDPSISADGRFVAFTSSATNLILGDTNRKADIFVSDWREGTVERVSVQRLGGEANGNSVSPSITANGRLVAFTSAASNLVSKDKDTQRDIFRRGRGVLFANQSDLLVDFGAQGLWQWTNQRRWLKIDNSSPSVIAVGDIDKNPRDDQIAAFPGRGLLVRYNNAGTFQKLDDKAAAFLAVGDFDGNGLGDLAADFGNEGVWVRVNGVWIQVRTTPSKGLWVGDLDGNHQDDLVASFGSQGLWVRYNNTDWVKVQTGAPSHVAAGDLNGNGQDDLIAAFGRLGLFVRYDNAAPWVKIRDATVEALATGNLDVVEGDDLLVDLGRGGLWAFINNADPWVSLDSRSPANVLLAAEFEGSFTDNIVADFARAGLFIGHLHTAFAPIPSAPAKTAQAAAAGRVD